MAGFLERFNIEHVGGWISTKDTDSALIRLGDDYECEVKAVLDRPDLKGSGKGFIFMLPAEVVENCCGRPLLVDVRCNGESIVNSPKHIVTNREEYSKVLHGKNGWLFLINDSNQSIKYITGQARSDSKVIQRWVELIQRRHGECSARGIPYIHMVCPEKEFVCSDYLPDGFFVDENRPVKQIQSRLSESISFIYPTFKDWTYDFEKMPPFTKGDTHWSYHGAYHATRIFFDELKKQGFDRDIEILSDYKFEKLYQASDLKIKLRDINIEPILFTKSLSKGIRCLRNNNFANAGRLEEYENLKGCDRLLVFHTSSIDWMKPFINDVFCNILYVWSREIDWELIDSFKPDFVFFQSNERFLTVLPNG